MNREIKFRGKAKRTREWVYGYYWTNENGNYFIRQTIDLNGCFSIADIEIDHIVYKCEKCGKEWI